MTFPSPGGVGQSEAAWYSPSPCGVDISFAYFSPLLSGGQRRNIGHIARLMLNNRDMPLFDITRKQCRNLLAQMQVETIWTRPNTNRESALGFVQLKVNNRT